MKKKCVVFLIAAVFSVVNIPNAFGGIQIEQYVSWTDTTARPVELAFPRCPLYTGMDAPGCAEPDLFITRVGQGGFPVESFGDLVHDPDSVVVDNDGRFCSVPGSVLVGGGISCNSQGKIWCVAPDGTTTLLWGPTSVFRNPSSMTIDSTGRLLIADPTARAIFESTGGIPTLLVSSAGAIGGIAVDGSGFIYTRDEANPTTIRKYQSDGTLVDASFVNGLGQGGEGKTLVAGPGGPWGTSLYAVANGLLVSINVNTGSITNVGSGLDGAWDLTFGPDGALYASIPDDLSTGHHKILRVTITGDNIPALGEWGLATLGLMVLAAGTILLRQRYVQRERNRTSLPTGCERPTQRKPNNRPPQQNLRKHEIA